MNIREAILKAADHIEANPGLFQFSAPCVPHDCGTPGCAIGWVGHFAGLHKQKHPNTATGGWYVHTLPDIPRQADIAALGVDYHAFYSRMDATGEGRWRDNADACARALRLYADKYHPAEAASDTIPAEVLAIFGKVAA